MLWGLSLSSVVPSGHLTLTAFGSVPLTISFSVQGACSNLGPLHCLLLDYSPLHVLARVYWCWSQAAQIPTIRRLLLITSVRLGTSVPGAVALIRNDRSTSPTMPTGMSAGKRAPA